MTNPAAIKVPPYYPDSPVVREELARMYDNIADMDGQVGSSSGSSMKTVWPTTPSSSIGATTATAFRVRSGRCTTRGFVCR